MIKSYALFESGIQQKNGFPFICLEFGVIGSALGDTPQQMSLATGFGLSVAIIFSYYLSRVPHWQFRVNGLNFPILAGWLP